MTPTQAYIRENPTYITNTNTHTYTSERERRREREVNPDGYRMAHLQSAFSRHAVNTLLQRGFRFLKILRK